MKHPTKIGQSVYICFEQFPFNKLLSHYPGISSNEKQAIRGKGIIRSICSINNDYCWIAFGGIQYYFKKTDLVVDD